MTDTAFPTRRPRVGRTQNDSLATPIATGWSTGVRSAADNDPVINAAKGNTTDWIEFV